jgi:hypothetical protein
VWVIDLPYQYCLVVQEAPVFVCLRRINQQVRVNLLDSNPIAPKGITCQVDDTAGAAAQFPLDLVFPNVRRIHNHGSVQSQRVKGFHHIRKWENPGDLSSLIAHAEGNDPLHTGQHCLPL